MEPALIEWPQRAACRGLDPAMFFPERGDVLGVRAAKAVCARCEVVTECLTESLAEPIVNGSPVGIRGGLSAQQRKRMASERRAARAA